jgi:hypothetical protein
MSLEVASASFDRDRDTDILDRQWWADLDQMGECHLWFIFPFGKFAEPIGGRFAHRSHAHIDKISTIASRACP